MNSKEYTYYYFLGVGGIGMSALARYFNFKGARVLGYDRTPSELTHALQKEGIEVLFDQEVDAIPQIIRDNKDTTLVIYTPAIAANMPQFVYLQSLGYTCVKRAQVLGYICNNQSGIAISGTHGKTSVTTFTSHILYNSAQGCNAFLGGISKNFRSNYVFHPTSSHVVVEADEYDRSFHNLFPNTALVTSMDSDHLDIYGSHAAILDSFKKFISQIKPDGTFIYKKNLDVSESLDQLQDKGIRVYSYALQDIRADFYARSIQRQHNWYIIDLVTPFGDIEHIQCNLPGKVNIENMIAASAIALCNGVQASELVAALATLQGVERRFDVQVANNHVVYIDDYAHHPEELKVCISSIKELYSKKKITGIFQPHLYSRTRDFAKEFGASLSLLDEVILLDIYAARELPIDGVTSTLIFDEITDTQKCIVSKQELLNYIEHNVPQVLITMGAGDIDRFVKPIGDLLKRITQ